MAAVFSVIAIPIKFSLNPELGEHGTSGLIYFLVDLLTYIMYWADIFISMRTTYVDSFGEEVKVSRRIWRRYVTSINFWIDVLTLINMPSRGMMTSKFLSFFGIQKFIRITRLLKLCL